VPAFDLIPFTDAHLDDAAALLAARHQRDRAHEPGLSPRFATLEGARAAVRAVWQEVDARGVVALRGASVVGYLIGAPETAEIWGRSSWVRLGGHAIAADADADLYRDLYAALAPAWTALGCFAHFAMIPAWDRAALDAWFALGFGQQQAYALRTLAELEPPLPALDSAIEVRRAGPDDLDAMMAMQDVLATHLMRAPVYSFIPPEMHRLWHTDMAEALANPHTSAWLAVQGGDVLGAVLFISARPSDGALPLPERCRALDLAVTRPQAWGRGIARILTARGLAEARAAGFTHCVTDWRTANLPSSRLWPRQGFRPVVYRVARLIDARVAWAPAAYDLNTRH
jgi:ribosomal protein S18 acetylase RimI-like enzyme